MGSKENNGNNMSMGDIGMIRDILMGREMSEYDKRFAEVDAKIEQLHAEQLAKQEQLRADMNARFDRLEQLLAQNVQQLNTQMNQSSNGDKALLGKLFAELSQKLTP